MTSGLTLARRELSEQQALDLVTMKFITRDETDPQKKRFFENEIPAKYKDEAVKAREQLLGHFLTPIRIGAGEMRFLVWATEGMSGADIEMLVEAADQVCSKLS